MGRKESKRKEIGENTECQALRINLEGNNRDTAGFHAAERCDQIWIYKENLGAVWSLSRMGKAGGSRTS